MGFGAAVKTCFSKYLTFSGRARRPEYWWFVLFVAVGSILATIIDGSLFGYGTETEPATQVVSPIFSLATFLPLLAAGWRRLHDTGRPGWYVLIPVLLSITLALTLGGLIFGAAELDQGDPSVAAGETGGFAILAIFALVQLGVTILLIWWLTRPTQPGANRFGEEP